VIPCVLFEDGHLLVVNKPAGWNTHAPSPFAGEGLYDWLHHREPRWASLAIIHRLDKETSGVIVFGKTPTANRSLTEQFTAHTVRKKYLLLTDRAVPKKEFTVKTALVRVGEKYASRPPHVGGEIAETRFTTKPNCEFEIQNLKLKMVNASPLTGRTHQIRVHAAESGFPILGDILYGGTPAARVFLHAAEISFTHPATGEPVTFSAPASFEGDPRLALRAAFIERDQPVGARVGDPQPPAQDESFQSHGTLRSADAATHRVAFRQTGATNAFRLIHGASDGWPGWYVELLGDHLLSQSELPLSAEQRTFLQAFIERDATGIRGVYHKTLNRQVRRSNVPQASPQLALGEAAPEKFSIRENGVTFELSFQEGYSVGLFLDQRDNRRRFLTGHIAADFPLFKSEIENRKSEILNCFAYTCGFSVCAALAGAHTTSLDLSRKYLDWGRHNFAHHGLDPAAHEFIFGDAFDWLRRLAKKSRAYDAIVLDPPTFSQSKERGAFQAEKDFGKLTAAALPLLRPDGVLLCSTNAAKLEPEKFLEQVTTAVRAAGRKILRQHYVPQPPDFPVSRAEPAYLKTVWLKIG